MAKNENVVSMTFDGQALGEPQDFSVVCDGQILEDSAGIDRFQSVNQLNHRKVVARCVFKDLDNAMTMYTSKWGGIGSLVLVTRAVGTTDAKTTTIANARCKQVAINAAHAEIGVHVAEFVSVSSDGSSTPIS